MTAVTQSMTWLFTRSLTRSLTKTVARRAGRALGLILVALVPKFVAASPAASTPPPAAEPAITALTASAAASPTPTPGEATPDPFVIKQKILSSGVPAASVGRLLAYIAKNVNQEMDLKVYFCKDEKTKEYLTDDIAPCDQGDAEPGVRKIVLKRPRYVGVLDFSKPSTVPRLYLIDLQTGDVQKFYSVHGKGSGDSKWATKFSNKMNSNQSALGLYYVQGTYVGHKGPTLRLYGLESSNDMAYTRDIVLHGAWYARPEFATNINPRTKKPFDRLGLSWGCPAVPPETEAKIIPLLKDGALLDLYQPDLMDLALTGAEVSVPEPSN